METKEQKLAAARKKLRQYQKKKTDKFSTNGKHTPVSEICSSEHSSSRSSLIDEFINGLPKDDIPSQVFQHGSEELCDEQTSSRSLVDISSVQHEFRNSSTLNQNGNEVPLLTANESQQDFDTVDCEGSVSSDTNVTAITAIPVDSSKESSLKSTTETLRQLSLQMSGLVQDSEGKGHSSGSEQVRIALEKRNSELAALYEQEKQTSFQQSQLIEELKNRISSLESQLKNANLNTHDGYIEVNGLREQLQVHIQTIGILVAEKSELQSSLSHARHALEQKAGEVNELEGRLNASRQRVREMEMSVQEMENENTALKESSSSEHQHVINLQNSSSKANKINDELKVTVAELTERLSIKTEENQRLTAELTDTKKQLELAQLHVHQLRDNTIDEMRSQLEHLQIQYNESANKVNFLSSSLEKSQNERTQMEQQYKTYTRALSTEMDQLKEKIGQRDECLQKIELENKALQKKLNEAKPKLQTSIASIEQEKEELKISLSKLENEKNILLSKSDSLTKDNNQLSQLLSEQRHKLESLEMANDRRNTEEIDTTQLLQSLQSDKVAAARALQQNKQLKEQLEELQNGFIMMSNKKLELTEKLENELFSKKKFNKDMMKLNETIISLKEKVLSKERENSELRETIASQEIVNNELNVRALVNSVESEEKQSNELSQPSVSTEAEAVSENKSDNEEVVAPKNSAEEVIKAVSTTIETEEQLKEEPKLTKKDIVSNEAAREALEIKFKQCMEELASTRDENQRLEHLVQQLQMETEAVGDYITIYQFQRGVMKKQLQELHLELDSLRIEKRETVEKLTSLQTLVSQLVLDKVPYDENLLKGLHSFINLNNTEDYKDRKEDDITPDDNLPQTSPTKTDSLPKNVTTSSNSTVQQIMGLIKEMEATNHIDHSVINKFHSCPLCSGKLITV